MSKRVNKNLEQDLSKKECRETALSAAKKELEDIEARRSLVLEAILVFEKLAEREREKKSASG